jgi:dCMP deaminase
MNWDEYAMSIAEVVAKKSKDPWYKVGVVILREDNSVASVGYNGFPQGVEEDWSDREERRKYVIHAEQNALRYTSPGEGRVLVSTLLPCRDCLKTIAAYKIKRVLYKDVYKTDPIALDIAEKMGVTLTQFKKEPFISNLDQSFKVGQFVKFEGLTAAKTEQAIQGTYYVRDINITQL